MKQTRIGLRQAIEAHFEEVDRLGIRQGENRVASTTIYIDNIKAFTIKSTKSKIGECKIYDPRIKMLLNVHPKGILFLNANYNYVFGDSKDSILATLTDLISGAIPDCTDNRVKSDNVNNLGVKMFNIVAVVISVLSILPFIVCINKWGIDDVGFIFCFTFLPVILAYIVSLISIQRGCSNLISIISFACASIIEIAMFIAVLCGLG